MGNGFAILSLTLSWHEQQCMTWNAHDLKHFQEGEYFMQKWNADRREIYAQSIGMSGFSFFFLLWFWNFFSILLVSYLIWICYGFG
jgi:hypothetical protein